MNQTAKPAFPEVAPVIEVFPGVHATLMSDYTRFSNGSIPFGGTYMNASSNGKEIGLIGCDAGGNWIFKIEAAWYCVNMQEAFNAAQDAHITSL